ncbi:hypothetical protein VM1G_05376 [Cytospora mali]|uniref:Uncharacterized protein n=1 Tax=Cytospora mali TaxID=578113 RepID=A0A194W0Y0_CYTMA|nr:hypothetical protein VM1G_05376 [Valsa mali]
MSTITPEDIYIGLWTDWSKGKVLGATITVTAATGVILAAFIAIFVNLAVGNLWNMVAYAIHQTRTTDSQCHPMLRQQQVILKNNTTPLATGIRLAQLLWTWPWNSQRTVFWSSLVLTVLTFSCALGGVIAGIFSSSIVATTDIEVLLSSQNCGFWQENVLTLGVSLGITWDNATNRFYQQEVGDSRTYARSCYNASSLRTCNTFVKPTIDWTTRYDAPCPFDGMCIGAAMEMDTGLINSNAILGMNFPHNQQFEFRRVTTCAPLVQDGYITTENSTDIPGDQILYYNYGPTNEEGTILHNATWEASVYASNLTNTYTLGSIMAYSGDESDGQFLPIAAMNRSDVDTTLMFLAGNNVRNTNPVNDPIFSAHRVGEVPYHGNVYYSDYVTSVVGCTEQYQFCNPTDKKCTKLTGMDGAYTAGQTQLDLNASQNVTMEVLYHTVRFWGASILVNAMSSPPNLLALDDLEMYVQSDLPDNQWQIEVQNWHATALVNIQNWLLLRVIGPQDPTARQFVNKPATDAEGAVCKAQKVRVGQGFNNISLFGLIFVLAFGSVTTLLSTFINDIAILVGKLSRRKPKDQRSWNRDDVLQIQRLAYQGQSNELWARPDAQIPIVTTGGLLGPLREYVSLKQMSQEKSISTTWEVIRRCTT